jgi:hypothetical protein
MPLPKDKTKIQDWKDKIRKKLLGKGCMEKNGMWKGNKVGKNGLHRWIERRKPKPEFCEICNKRKPYDLSNISGKYKRDINDYKWVCRSCHMKGDGRLKKLMLVDKNIKEKIRIKKICLNCKKRFYIKPSLKDIRKTCSKKCMGKYKSKNNLFYGNQYIKSIKQSKNSKKQRIKNKIYNKRYRDKINEEYEKLLSENETFGTKELNTIIPITNNR